MFTVVGPPEVGGRDDVAVHEVKLHSKRVENMWIYTRNEWGRCITTLVSSVFYQGGASRLRPSCFQQAPPAHFEHPRHRGPAIRRGEFTTGPVLQFWWKNTLGTSGFFASSPLVSSVFFPRFFTYDFWDAVKARLFREDGSRGWLFGDDCTGHIQIHTWKLHSKRVKKMWNYTRNEWRI